MKHASVESAPDRLDMMRRITRGMTVTSDLRAVLDSITSALVEHAGAVVSRVFL